MELTALTELLKFGVEATLLVMFVLWILKVDIPAREKRHSQERETWAQSLREDREVWVQEFQRTHQETREDHKRIYEMFARLPELVVKAIREGLNK